MYGKLIADVFSKLPADLLFKQVKGKTGNIRIKGRKHPGVAWIARSWDVLHLFSIFDGILNYILLLVMALFSPNSHLLST